MRQVTTIEFKQLIRRGVDLFNLRFIQFPFCILFLYFIFVFISEGGTLPSTNTISKPINELEKMLDTNKETRGKLPATSMDNLSLNLRHGRFTSHLSRQTTNISYCSGLLWSDQFQIIPCLAFPCLAWKLSLALISNQTRTRLEH